ncbi:MAG: VCBS domain-containing protein, partial [Cycloclasticus sp.]
MSKKSDLTLNEDKRTEASNQLFELNQSHNQKLEKTKQTDHLENRYDEELALQSTFIEKTNASSLLGTTANNGETDSTSPSVDVNDVAVAGAAVTASVEEGEASMTGQLSASDVDAGATTSFSITDGSTAPEGFTLTADGRYRFDPSDPAYDHLKAGDSTVLSIPVTVTDEHGATDTSQIQITVTGTNQAPIAGAAVTASVEEGEASMTG